MKIHCPHCGVKGSAEDSYSGRKVKCPKCTTIFEVKPDMAIDLTEDPTAVSAKVLETDSPVLREKSLDWADIAAEIDLDLTEEDVVSDTKAEVGLPGGEIEEEPYGVDTEQCWQCGKKDTAGEPFIEKDDRLYCIDCVPLEEFHKKGGEDLAQDTGFSGDAGLEPSSSFSIKETLRQAWEQTKGAKGAIWAGSAIMYLVLLIIVAGGAFFLPSQTAELPDIQVMLSTALFQAITDAVFALFTAGLLFIGIRKVAGDMISWKMTFNGFSCAGKIILATILQAILVTIGFLLLILPGIYLTVGYSMTMPLIVDKGLSPWQALETSRKAVHKVWWKVAGLLFVMGVLFVVSIIPLGIGLIWTWPMFIVLAGVVYKYLFRLDKKTD